MARQWYCNIDGHEVGPLATAQLRQLAAAGKIVAATPIRCGDDGKWVTAAKVSGLIPSATAVVPPPVHAASPVAAPAGQVAQAARPAIVDADRSPVRRAKKKSKGMGPVAVAATLLLLALAIGGGGVAFFVWNLNGGAPLASAPQDDQQPPAIQPAAGTNPTVAEPAAATLLSVDELLASVTEWYDAKRNRVGPGKTAKFQVKARAVPELSINNDEPADANAVPPEAKAKTSPESTSLGTALGGSARATTDRNPLDDPDRDISVPLDDLSAPRKRVLVTPSEPPTEESPAGSTPTAATPAVDEKPKLPPKYLAVELIVSSSQSEPLVYRGMNGLAGDAATAVLVDDLNQRYLPVALEVYDSPDRIREVEIAPGETVTDLIVFPLPEAGYQYLRLALPNSSIGRSGATGFDIRAETVETP